MVFSKYLFATIAGLAGGVNWLAFSPLGGALIQQELQNYSGEIDNSSREGDSLVSREEGRLNKERQESSTKFKNLEDENEKTKDKSRSRRSAGEQLSKEDHNLKLSNYKHNSELNSTKNKLEAKLKSSTDSFKTSLEASVKTAFQEVKSKVDEETKRLEDALKTLQKSNQELIQKVRTCIENLPQEIFVTKPEESKCLYDSQKT
ncbi:hypothetical protein [Candidatus Mycoplasma haematominutum]|uniref:Uncharacterized protein n=1 Tax=Candidatus Mycoplasma haematominutum 'Birmingham 1' TaxID=1116213 RepID=G8C3C4_9MOLU|nr:hypothetical protein [Candidatus Mycoplasma haematominutum]CCE66822.1 hypothetical protein MHM_03040 [Candidatus Mycoplasma haematominutum 'Birmingham 1']